jgi:hypothetical protein
VFWPRALKNPVDGPSAALETVSRYTAYDSPTLLRGKSISSNHVPWDYLPTYFAVQLPELTLLCFMLTVLGLGGASVFWLSRRRPVRWVWWLLVLAVCVPPGYAIVHGSTLYNGLRHFLFIIPPISVLAGAGFAVAVEAAAKQNRRFSLPLFALAVLFVLDQVHALWRLHPDQHVFFNRLSGGLRSAIGRYETEYYGSVYQELHAQFQEAVWQQQRERYLNTTWQVAGCGSRLFFTENLPLNFQYQSMRNAAKADYYATYARDNCLSRFRDRRIVTDIRRDGVSIAIARDMKRKLERRPKTVERP